MSFEMTNYNNVAFNQEDALAKVVDINIDYIKWSVNDDYSNDDTCVDHILE